MKRVDIAYVRVSREEADDDRSLEEQQRGQVDACKRLAERDGSTDLRIVSDWDRSADPAKEHRRTGFLDMLASIERGDVGTVYVRSLDRLYRSGKTFWRLTEAARKHDTRIVSEREGILGGDSPMAQAFAEMTAVFAGLELATAKSRAASRVTRQRAVIEEHERTCPGPHTCGVWSNHHMGHEPFGWKDGEDVEVVMEAFREAGSFLGAARLLTEHGVPSRRGNVWNPATVATIVRREDASAPRAVGRGVRATGAHRLSRLLLCPHDQTFLTTSRRRDGTMYVCAQGGRGNHPRPYAISENRVLPWLREQAAYVMELGMAEPPDEEAVRGEVTDLLAKRERFAMLFAEGDISEAVWRQRRDELDLRIEALRGSVQTYLTVVGGVRWTGSREQANSDLRDICASIRLGYSGVGSSRRLTPIGATWKRRPVIDVHDDEFPGATMLHPDAVETAAGWYLPAGAAKGKR